MVSEDSSNNSNNSNAEHEAANLLSRQSSHASNLNNNNEIRTIRQVITEEDMHLNKLRQHLGAGQKNDAIECAIKYNMWPHALFLSSSSYSISSSSSSTSTALSTLGQNQSNSETKSLNKVKLKYINSLHPNDPIHTCYQLLIGRIPTVASVRSYI